jgi:signal transduction histidine kinase
VPPLGVEELDDLGAALQRAARELEDANRRRARVEAERERLLARVEEALDAAEQANRNKDEFLALLGHELRNPLAPITNALHLMDLKADPQTARERNVIHRQLSYVTRLVDDLLDAARINSKRLVMNLQPLQPVRVLEQTLEAVRPSLGTRTLRIEIEPQARHVWAKADEARLVQIFNNLVGNATKFTTPEGTITASAHVHDGHVEMSIADDGVGMAPAELARAFDIFYQAPGSARARGTHGGLGLGLAIVKSLVEMHAGQVRAESDGPGAGTKVTLRLPLIDAAAELATTSAARQVVDAVGVLVCDDNEDAASTLAALLGATGYQAREVFSPEQAIEAFQQLRPAVAILDIGLPGMDGYELVQRLKALPAGDACKYVALTGYGQETDVKRAFGAGFDAHLTKPADPDVLLRLLEGFFPPASP